MKSERAAIFTCFWIVLVSVFLYYTLASCFKNDEETFYIKTNGDRQITKIIDSDEVEYKIQDEEGNFLYSWTFDKTNKEETKDSILIEDQIDFTIDTDVINPLINKLVSTEDKLVVSFTHHGNLPSDSIIGLNVSNDFDNGEKLYLYYFNENKNALEFIDNNITVKEGKLDFKIEHCSDYILSKEKIASAENNPLISKIYLFYTGLIGIIIFTIRAILFKGK